MKTKAYTAQQICLSKRFKLGATFRLNEESAGRMTAKLCRATSTALPEHVWDKKMLKLLTFPSGEKWGDQAKGYAESCYTWVRI